MRPACQTGRNVIILLYVNWLVFTWNIENQIVASLTIDFGFQIDFCQNATFCVSNCDKLSLTISKKYFLVSNFTAKLIFVCCKAAFLILSKMCIKEGSGAGKYCKIFDPMFVQRNWKNNRFFYHTVRLSCQKQPVFGTKVKFWIQPSFSINLSQNSGC